MSALRNWCTACICSLLAASLSSCGREAPWSSPPPPPETGSLIVRSTPAGAGILLDGVATATVTPDTLSDVPTGDHVVRVRLSGWVAAPDSLEVTVAAADTAEADFALEVIEESTPQLVLLEGFSNVNCVGCPQLAATLQALMSEAGHGLDRVLLIKYAANWPAANDPHYQANPTDNTARLTFYQSYLTVGIPTLSVNGALAGASGQPPSLADLRTLVDGQLQGNPGLYVTVVATGSDRGTSIGASVTLHAERALAGPNSVLNLALVQDLVTYVTPPGSEGETEFHWIMRDFASAAEAPLPLAHEETRIIDATLTRQSAWPLGNLYVIAFVQDSVSRQIMQAGFGPVTESRASIVPSTLAGPPAGPRSRELQERGRP